MEPTSNNDPGLRYLRIANSLRTKIVEGVYQPGEPLPKQHDMAKELGVAYATLKRALDILEQEGFVVSKVGRGTYAALPEKRVVTALVIDDEDNIRKSLKAALKPSGWESVTAESGEVGLERFKEQRFDLVFLDLMMPGMNGAETFRAIRKLDPQVDVVIMTGFPDPDIMSEVLKVGPFSVMMKPFGLKELRTVLERVETSL